MDVMAHRGASLTHPENSLAAFRAAIEVGADAVELDVRRTADEVLVVFHDAHLADGRMLADVEAAELDKSIPTLAEALEVCSSICTNVEVKNLPGDPDYDPDNLISVAVAGLIGAHQATQRVIVSSFNTGSLLRLRSESPEIPLAWIVWGQADPRSLLERAAGVGVNAIHPHDLLVDARFVAAAHDLGMAVNVWTVNDPLRIRELATFGIDGVMTDDPAMAVRVLAEG